MHRSFGISWLLPLFLSVIACQKLSFLDNAQAQFYELETGQPLSPAKAARAGAVFGSLQTDLAGSRQSVSFVRIRPGAYGITVVTAEGQLADSTSALCRRIGAVAGINGSYFNMRAMTPVTYVKDDGVVSGTTTPDETYRTNGAVLIDGGNLRIDAAEGGAVPDKPWSEALASGPILIDEGVVISYGEDTPGWESFYNRRHPRSLIGRDGEGCIWLIVVDGRAPGSAAGMTVAELTDLCRRIGLTDALNLDGGGSSTLWTLGAGVISHPTDNRRFDHAGERRVPNILAVTKP